MTLIETLEHEGFAHHVSDEPYEDYWLLEDGLTPDLLVEFEGKGWRICRTPQDEEPRGTWVDVADDLTDEACLGEVARLLDERRGTAGSTRT